MEKIISVIGLFVLVLIAFLFSENKKKINIKLVIWGISLQIIFALLILKTSAGKQFFVYVNHLKLTLMT